jgi:hypothetical protein
MKSKHLFTALVLGLMLWSTATTAQNGRFSLGLELGSPVGEFGDDVSIGFGGSVRYEHPIGDMMGLTGTVGYLTFAGKEFDIFPGISVDGPNLALIPIQAGFKYYFSEQQLGFYGMVELGVHLATYDGSDYSVTDPNTGITFSSDGETASETYLSYAPQIGYHLDNFDFGLRYQMFSQSTTVAGEEETATASYLGLRIAYVFGSKD